MSNLWVFFNLVGFATERHHTSRPSLKRPCTTSCDMCGESLGY